jgi:hypothetical protein
MRWNRVFIVCCSSILFFSFAGCKEKEKVIRINIVHVDQSLKPLSAIAAPGRTLQWVAMASGDSFDVVFQSGLCTQKSPIHASYRKPAECTIAPQDFGRDKRPILYTYSLKGEVNGKPLEDPDYPILVAPDHCDYCQLVGPRNCPHCSPAY